MSGYWNTYGIGDGGAWIDWYGNHVDPRTYPDEDALCAAGYRWVDQRNGADWIARNLGDVPHETIGGWRSATGTRTPWYGDCIPVESLGRDA